MGRQRRLRMSYFGATLWQRRMAGMCLLGSEKGMRGATMERRDGVARYRFGNECSRVRARDILLGYLAM
jgi:hypothetical protein